jgi:Cu(I)/Ag(I) efflux system membrane fusion protein
MNRILNTLRWLAPVLIVSVGMASAAWIYQDELRRWFAPSTQTSESVPNAGDMASMPGMGGTPGESSEDAGAADHANQIAYWTCSMHPSVKSATPGKCPICAMDLIPVTHGEVDTGVIRVEAQRRQLIGVVTGPVERRSLSKELRAAGSITVDETHQRDLTLRNQAWIGEVYADFTGKSVRKGEPLFTFYSPELWTAQQEFLETVRRAKDDPDRGARMVDAAKARLRLWQIDDAQIAALRERGRAIEYLTFNSPASGTVIEKNIVAGSAAAAGERLFRIADLSTVWIDAAFYADEQSLLAAGQEAAITLTTHPKVPVTGAVSYIYPDMDPETRTVRVRIEVANLDGMLKPGMFAGVSIAVPLGERLVVPEGAVIFAGRTHLAFADLGEGRLEPRRLTIGAQARGFIEVLDGLKEGESVVTSANFLIAAESRLKSGVEKW